MPAKLTKEQFVERANRVHGNKYDYSDLVYVTAHTLSKIKCKVHGDFNQKPYSHLNGSGCPECSVEVVGQHSRDRSPNSVESIKKQFAETHGDKYTYENFLKFKTVHDVIQITCPVHGSFSQSILAHRKGSGCLGCVLDSRGDRYHQQMFDEFVEEARSIHGTKYEYIKSSFKTRDTISFKCNKDHVTDSTVYKHLDPRDGCRECALEPLKQKSISQYGDIYDFDVNTFNLKSGYIQFSCNKHIVTDKINIDKHLKRNQCKQCYEELKLDKAKKLSYDKFVEKASKVHEGMDYEYPYDKFDHRATSPLVFICPEHGEQTISSKRAHLKGSICYECYKPNVTSSYIRHLYVDACINGSNLYIIKFMSEDETFYKIGISNNMDRRINEISRYVKDVYTIELIETFYCKDSGIIWDLEREIHGNLKSYRASVKHKFSGHTECFDITEEQVLECSKLILERTSS